MSNVDLYCKMLKKGVGMGKRTLISEDALSLSDDNNLIIIIIIIIIMTITLS